MRKFLLCASLAGLLLTGVSMWAHVASAKSASQQQSEKTTNIVTGKVSSIGNSSFALDVGGTGDSQTWRFVLDKNAKVQGHVKVGATVTVEFAREQGQNVVLSVTAQG